MSSHRNRRNHSYDIFIDQVIEIEQVIDIESVIDIG